MNEALHIFQKFQVHTKVNIKHLKIDEADMKTMRDMPTLIKDTKKYIEDIRKGITNG